MALCQRRAAEQDPQKLPRPSGVPSDAILRVLRVPPESAGMRLDVFVQSQLRNTSRTRARAIVENSAFALDGRRLRPNGREQAEDRIMLWRPLFDEIDAAPELPILYEDEHLLAVDKPPLVAVHPTARHHHSTVIKQLQAIRPGEFFSLIHRLDRETSGILLVARNPEAERAFKRLLEDRSTRPGAASLDKGYLAITWGVPATGDIDLPLELDRDSPLRVKMRVAPAVQGMPARTGVQVIETRGRYALIRCQLHTGRQHQIRVHLTALGCPIVGDKLYGPDERLLARAADRCLDSTDLALLELPRHALHAAHYRMRHAVSGAPLEIVSPLPPDLADFWLKSGATQ
jgi:23S rRNA pseudouridine1911/1915/1917 synthase